MIRKILCRLSFHTIGNPRYSVGKVANYYMKNGYIETIIVTRKCKYCSYKISDNCGFMLSGTEKMEKLANELNTENTKLGRMLK
jgi:hypothetical protein